MEKIFKKLLAVVLVIFLVFNLFFYAVGGIDLLFFWINLLIIGVISFLFYGGKDKLKRKE